jgi:hypothetical protein
MNSMSVSCYVINILPERTAFMNKYLKEYGKFIQYINIIYSQSLASDLVVYSNEYYFRNNKIYAYCTVKFLCASTQ